MRCLADEQSLNPLCSLSLVRALSAGWSLAVQQVIRLLHEKQTVIREGNTALQVVVLDNLCSQSLGL